MKHLKKLFVIILLLLLPGCEYTTQLCTHSRVDIGLEGTYDSSNYDWDEFIPKPAEGKIVRDDVGVYSGGGQILYTCRFNGKLLLESYNQADSTFISYRIENLGRDFLLSPTVFDRRELDREKIPYSVTYRNASTMMDSFYKFEITENTFKKLVVDNRNVPADKIASLMHIQSLGIRLQRK